MPEQGGRRPARTQFNEEKRMIKRALTLAALPAVFLAGAAIAQYPVLDMVANKVVQKYQSSTCEQLWAERDAKQGKPKPEAEQRAIDLLRNDAKMRAEFFNRVSAPIVTKMFECGMIP
jgi:hypothetical protein